MTTRTRTQSAGDYSHGESHYQGGNKFSSRPSQAERSKYYAGAKFDTVPSLSDLPAPPRHWTGPAARSQSTPSSPVTIPTKPSAGISLDMGSLFGPRPQPSCDKGQQETGGILKSASLPGQSGMLKVVAKRGELKASPVILASESKTPVVFKTPQNKKVRSVVEVSAKPQVSNSPGVNQVTSNQRPVTPSEGQRSPARGISGLDLMEMLLRASPTGNGQDLKATPSAVVNTSPVKMASPCHLQLGSSHNQYKDVSDHLKSILKVSA